MVCERRIYRTQKRHTVFCGSSSKYDRVMYVRNVRLIFVTCMNTDRYSGLLIASSAARVGFARSNPT